MKPVDQTNFDSKKGDCFSACVASILELPLEAVPVFAQHPGEWFEYFLDWLSEQKMFAVMLSAKNTTWKLHDEVICIAGGKSPRGDWMHGVVWQGGKCIHDPHFSRDGIDGEPEDFTLLFPFDVGPSKKKVGEEEPYLDGHIPKSLYNPNYGDDRICKCDHLYYRHFDTYSEMLAVGCKYCSCDTFEEIKRDPGTPSESSEAVSKEP